jgi:hypothetical protein
MAKKVKKVKPEISMNSLIGQRHEYPGTALLLLNGFSPIRAGMEKQVRSVLALANEKKIGLQDRTLQVEVTLLPDWTGDVEVRREFWSRYLAANDLYQAVCSALEHIPSQNRDVRAELVAAKLKADNHNGF